MFAVGKERMVGHVIVTAVRAVILPLGDSFWPEPFVGVIVVTVGFVYHFPRLAGRVADLTCRIATDVVSI